MSQHPTVPKPSILIFIEYYQPGYRFGGPVQAVTNLVTLLRDRYDLFIVARDRDVGDRRPYPGLRVGAWVAGEGCRICYLAPAEITLRRIGQLLRERPDALVYTNSLFSIFTRLLLLNSFSTKRPVIVAPRGELHPGALRQKVWKKLPFIKLAGWLFRGRMWWHATAAYEKDLIHQWFRVSDRQVSIAPDLPGTFSPRPAHPKIAGQLHLVWLARIAPNKGLHFLLDCLQHVTAGPIRLAIYGPVADMRYWRNCQSLMARLPAQHEVIYLGEVPHTAVRETLLPHDFLVLPTEGENFGHVIAESLSLGLPVLISNQTPWRNLHQQRAGYDLPLQRDEWVNVLTACLQMDSVNYANHTQGAPTAARQFGDHESALVQYQRLFSPSHRLPCFAMP